MKKPIKLIRSILFPVVLLLSFALRSLSAAETFSPYVTQQVDVDLNQTTSASANAVGFRNDLHGLVPESSHEALEGASLSPLTDGYGPLFPQSSVIVSSDNTWASLTWDLGGTPEEIEERTLERLDIWIANGDNNRRGFQGDISVSVDGINYETVPNTYHHQALAHRNGPFGFNHIRYDFPCHSIEAGDPSGSQDRFPVRNFRYLRLNTRGTDAPGGTGTDWQSRITEVEAWFGTTAPAEIVSTGTLEGRRIGISFNKRLDAASVFAGNFQVSGTPGTFSAQLRPDGRNVELIVFNRPGGIPGLQDDTFTVTASNLVDACGNAIPPLTAEGESMGLNLAKFGREFFPPFQAYVSDSSRITVYGSGGNIWGTGDEMDFISEERTGDFDVKVQVVEFWPPHGDRDAKAALMVREELTGGSRNTGVTAYNPSVISSNEIGIGTGPGEVTRTWSALWRLETNGETTTADPGSRVFWSEESDVPNVWMRIRREGNTIYRYGGSNGQDWQEIGTPLTANYPETVHVGLATASRRDLNARPVEIVYANYGDYVPLAASPSLTLTKGVDGEITLSWTETAGYALYSSDDLVDWTPAQEEPVAEDGVATVTLETDLLDRQFYRLQQ